MGALASLTLAAFFGERGWLFELAEHFRLLSALGLGAIAAGFLLARQPIGASVSAVFALVHLGMLLPYFRRAPRFPMSPPVDGIFANVLTANHRHARVRDLTYNPAVDLIALVEINERWLRELAPLRRHFPYAITFPSDDNNRGMALFSRLPIGEAGMQEFGDPDRPCLVARLSAGEDSFCLVLAHPLPPKAPRMAKLRDEQLDAIAAYIRERPDPWVILGDLNLTPWSHPFREFLRQANLEDGRRGLGFNATWPSSLPLFPIDHVLTSANLVVTRFRVGPPIGSDHRPILFEFALRPDEPGQQPEAVTIPDLPS